MSSHLKSHILEVKRSSNILLKGTLMVVGKAGGGYILVLVNFPNCTPCLVWPASLLLVKTFSRSVALDLHLCACALLTHSSSLSSAGFPSGCYKLMLWPSSRCQSGLLAVKVEKHG